MAKNIMEVKLNIDADGYQKILNETIGKVEELKERLERLNHPNIHTISNGNDITIVIGAGEEIDTIQIGTAKYNPISDPHELCIKSGTIDANKLKGLTVDQISKQLAEKLRENI